jgi:non-ribosomal peptide synthetase component E (peptide arylation enzyme)
VTDLVPGKRLRSDMGDTEIIIVRSPATQVDLSCGGQLMTANLGTAAAATASTEEDVLLEHPSVADVAVLGIPDEHWGQDIAAAVVFRPGHTVSTEELRQWARTRLRGSKTPALIVVRGALPQTATGKVLRRELLADLLATELAPTP